MNERANKRTNDVSRTTPVRLATSFWTVPVAVSAESACDVHSHLSVIITTANVRSRFLLSLVLPVCQLLYYVYYTP